LLVDINMPKMDGFKLAAKVFEQDINVKVCFVTAAEINTQALKEQYQTLSVGLLHKKASYNRDFGQ
jgi:YesN/AraC family two-component response regulator